MILGPVLKGLPQGEGQQVAPPMPAAGSAAAFADILARLAPKADAPPPVVPDAPDSVAAPERDQSEDESGASVELPEAAHQQAAPSQGAALPVDPGAARRAGPAGDRSAAMLQGTASSGRVHDGVQPVARQMPDGAAQLPAAPGHMTALPDAEPASGGETTALQRGGRSGPVPSGPGRAGLGIDSQPVGPGGLPGGHPGAAAQRVVTAGPDTVPADKLAQQPAAPPVQQGRDRAGSFPPSRLPGPFWAGRPVQDVARTDGRPGIGHRAGETDVPRSAVPVGLPALPDAPGLAGSPPISGTHAAAPMPMSAGSPRGTWPGTRPDPDPPARPGRDVSPRAGEDLSAEAAPTVATAGFVPFAGSAASARAEDTRPVPEQSTLVAPPGTERSAAPGASAAPVAPPAAAPPPAAQIAAAVSALGGGRTEIVLAPDELGRVAVTLTVKDGSMSVAIVAERGETTDLIRRNLDQLAQEFRDLGYGDVSFHFGSGPGGDRAFGATSARSDPTDAGAPMSPDLPDAGDDDRPTTARAIGRMDLRF